MTIIKVSIGNVTRTLALISAGALLGIFLLAPLSAGASSDDEPEAREEGATTFVLKATNGQSFTFELVDNGGQMEFVPVSPAVRVDFIVDDDDD